MTPKQKAIDPGKLLDLWLISRGHDSDSLRKIELGHYGDLLKLQTLGVIGFLADVLPHYYHISALASKSVKIDKLFPGLAKALGIDKETLMEKKKEGGDGGARVRQSD